MTPSNRQARERQSPPKIEQRAGDSAVQIGQVFGDAVFQLLSPKTAIAILVAVAITAISLYYLYRAAQKPAQMTGDFNIAVAQFGEVTDEGIVSSAQATQISKLLFDFLDSEYKATDFGLDIQVAQKKIGILTEDREAEHVAYEMGADVVIYGSVFVVGDEAMLSPKFYVGDQPDTAELTGQHELGLPIQFDIHSFGFQNEVNTSLQSRAATLVFFTTGLVYLSADDLDNALDSFEEAVREAEGYSPFDGQEVLYLFAAHTSRRQQDFEKAAGYLDQALSLNPEYARAYLARGNIYYVQALPSWDQSKLERALLEYEAALEAKDQPDGAYITEKANTSLGNVYVVKGQITNDPELLGRAIDYYAQVVTRYERTHNDRIRGLAAIAYFGMGVAYERQKAYKEAADRYRQCVDVALDSELRSHCAKKIGIIEGQY